MPKVRFQEWSDREIAEACSFKVLIDRVYRTYQTREGGGKYASRKWMKSNEAFNKWQQTFRDEITETLKIRDAVAEARKDRGSAMLKKVYGNKEKTQIGDID